MGLFVSALVGEAKRREENGDSVAIKIVAKMAGRKGLSNSPAAIDQRHATC